MTEPAQMTPQQAWDLMSAGNARFVGGAVTHPNQHADRRRALAGGQNPHAVIFGCSDSRPAAEIIFDEGLGDLFVVRNAGQVISPSVVGSIEFAVAILHTPVLVVLGHEKCGAVRAAIDSTAADAPVLPAAIWRLIAPIVPTVHEVARAASVAAEAADAVEVGREHLSDTLAELLQSSTIVADAVAEGRLGVVTATYQLTDGTVTPHSAIGPITIPGL